MSTNSSTSQSNSSILTSTSRKKSSRSIVVGALLILSGVFIGRYLVPAQVEGSSPFQLVSVDDSNQRQIVFPTFWEAWDTLHKLYIDDLDDKELFYGAVAGMVKAAGDPYTAFANPEDTKQFQETLSGSFSGVGIEIGPQNGVITVIAPLKDSPADKAGIQEGDIILAVDDEPITADQTINDVVKHIRGVKGEPVKLTVVHKNDREPKDYTITRDTITIESVTSTIEDGIAHIEISSFNGDTVDQFAAAVRDSKRANVQGVILDVRSNPGGFLQSAVDIASYFLEPGSIVVSERGQENQVYKTKGAADLKNIPVVVLMNEGSASASEILAGALSDQRQAPLIGQKSFGKGSVQELINLKDGSSVKVTIAKWFTPNGHSINKEGIEPAITVEQNRDTDEDEQLDRAKEEVQRLISS